MLESKYKMTTEGDHPNCVIHCPSGSKELKELVKKLRFSNKITAVTYFVFDLNSDSFNTVDPKKFIKDRFATNFDRINILSRDGELYHL